MIKAIVIFDTRYGNTEKIARSLEAGLREVGIETRSVNSKDMAVDLLGQYNLICVGAPTEKITASQSIKEFLSKLGRVNLAGKHGFAFDTKLPYPLTGSAAKHIEKELWRQGIQVIARRESAEVFYPKGGKESDVRLKEGEESRFEQIGKQIGATLASKAARRVVIQEEAK